MTTTKKKKSGLTRDRAFKLQQSMKDSLADIYNAAIIYKLTHEEISDRSCERVFWNPKLRKAPEHVLAYLNGYAQARRDELYRYHLAWMLWLDGKLMTGREVDALTEEDKITLRDKDPNYRSPWQRIDNEKSRHVWKDSNGALTSCPFDRKWKV